MFDPDNPGDPEKQVFDPPKELINQGTPAQKNEWERYWRDQKERLRVEMLNPEEIDFLLRFAAGMKKRLPSFPEFDRFNPHEGRLDPTEAARDFLMVHLRRYVQPASLLRLRDRYAPGSRNRRLPEADVFATEVVAGDNFIFQPIERVRRQFAETARAALAETLGLRAEHRIESITNGIIAAVYRRRDQIPRGRLHAEIARELVAQKATQDDPRLRKWIDELQERRLNWQDALEHPSLRKRVKKLFSTFGNSATE